MKLSETLLAGLLGVYAMGAVAAIAIPIFAEGVNIAEVEGKYKQPTVEDAVQRHRVLAIQLMNEALHEAWLAGYGKAMIDFEVVPSTQPAKVIDREEQHEDER